MPLNLSNFLLSKKEKSKMADFQDLDHIDGVSVSTTSANLYNNDRDDLVLFYFRHGAEHASVYTQSQIVSENIKWNKKIKTKKIRALLVNTRNANALTGKKGYEALEEISEEISTNLTKKQKEDEDHPKKVKTNEVLFGCTGTIGEVFPKDKIKLTGNPVRSSITENSDSFEKGIEYYGLDPNKKTMLVIGGSLGSREINKAIYSIQDYLKYINLQVIWQCGKLYFKEYKQKNIHSEIRLYDYLDKIDLAYSVSDFIISRAGASSVSELSIVGKPVIFIPSPNVAEDHQLKNAKSIVENEAALLVEEKNIDDLKKTISELNSSSDLRNKLSKNIKKSAFKNATKDIVDEIKILMN